MSASEIGAGQPREIRFLAELDDTQHASFIHQQQTAALQEKEIQPGIKMRADLGPTRLFFSQLFGQTVNVEVGNKTYAFGRNSLEHFLRRHAEEAGLQEQIGDDGRRGTLKYDDLAKGLRTLLDNKEVLREMGDAMRKLEKNPQKNQPALQVYKDLTAPSAQGQKEKYIKVRSDYGNLTLNPDKVRILMSEVQYGVFSSDLVVPAGRVSIGPIRNTDVPSQLIAQLQNLFNANPAAIKAAASEVDDKRVPGLTTVVVPSEEAILMGLQPSASRPQPPSRAAPRRPDVAVKKPSVQPTPEPAAARPQPIPTPSEIEKPTPQAQGKIGARGVGSANKTNKVAADIAHLKAEIARSKSALKAFKTMRKKDKIAEEPSGEAKPVPPAQPQLAPTPPLSTQSRPPAAQAAATGTGRAEHPSPLGGTISRLPHIAEPSPPLSREPRPSAATGEQSRPSGARAAVTGTGRAEYSRPLGRKIGKLSPEKLEAIGNVMFAEKSAAPLRGEKVPGKPADKSVPLEHETRAKPRKASRKLPAATRTRFVPLIKPSSTSMQPVAPEDQAAAVKPVKPAPLEVPGEVGGPRVSRRAGEMTSQISAKEQLERLIEEHPSFLPITDAGILFQYLREEEHKRVLTDLNNYYAISGNEMTGLGVCWIHNGKINNARIKFDEKNGKALLSVSVSVDDEMTPKVIPEVRVYEDIDAMLKDLCGIEGAERGNILQRKLVDLLQPKPASRLPEAPAAAPQSPTAAEPVKPAPLEVPGPADLLQPKPASRLPEAPAVALQSKPASKAAEIKKLKADAVEVPINEMIEYGNFSYCNDDLTALNVSLNTLQRVYDRAFFIVREPLEGDKHQDKFGMWGEQAIVGRGKGRELPHAAVVFRFIENIASVEQQKQNARFLNSLQHVPKEEKPILIRVAQMALQNKPDVYNSFVETLVGKKWPDNSSS